MFIISKSIVKCSSLLFLVIIIAGCSWFKKENNVCLALDQLADIEACETNNGAVFYADSIFSHHSLAPKEYPFPLNAIRKYSKAEENDFYYKGKYFYHTNDSLIRYAIHDWDRLDPEWTVEQTEQFLNQEQHQMNLYHQKFDDIANYLIEQYGMPVEGENNVKQADFAMLGIWKRNLIWQTNTHTIDLSLIWIPKSGYRIFKIHCKVLWK